MSIELADGQSWVFPVATDESEPAGNPLTRDPEVLDLLDAIREAEDRAEMLRAELALAIHLLDRNYLLDARELLSLLDFDPVGPSQTAAQRAFHELAQRAFRLVHATRRERPAAWPRGGVLARLISRLTRGYSATGQAAAG